MNILDYYQLLEYIHLHTKVSFVQTVPLTWKVNASLSILLTLQSSAKAPGASPNQNKWSFPLHAIYIWHLILYLNYLHIYFISTRLLLEGKDKYALYIT